jgi:hypothetical protein
MSPWRTILTACPHSATLTLRQDEVVRRGEIEPANEMNSGRGRSFAVDTMVVLTLGLTICSSTKLLGSTPKCLKA